jgi:uncharacterized protein (DUF305 family)
LPGEGISDTKKNRGAPPNCQDQFALPALTPPVVRFASEAKRMADKSSIEWTDATWNPVTGCTKISSDANKKATAAANSVGMTPPTAPNKKQQADYERMSKLSGAQFDKAFVTHMVADHKKDVKEYEKAAKKKDAAGSYATETLPALRKHWILRNL